MILKSTISFCTTCYKRIPADIYTEGDSIYMRKYCSEHGQTTAMVERDAEFYTRCMSMGQRGIYTGYMMDVTQRCNLSCAYCFYARNNTAKDPSIPRLLQEAFMARPYGEIIVTGGEPTLRDDLPQLLEQVRCVVPRVAMLTNGVRMTGNLLDGILPHLHYTNGAVGLNLSMHPESNGADRKVIQMMRQRGLKLESILWVIDDPSQIAEVVDFADANKDVIGVVRLKAASKMWAEQKPDNHIFVSDMLKHLEQNLYKPKTLWWANNKVSFFNVEVNGLRYMLVSWYNVNNIDLLDINCPPVYKSKIGVIENLVTAAIVNEGLSKGWVDGMEVNYATS